MQSVPRDDINSLTGLRFIAAFLVLLAHALDTAASDFSNLSLASIARQLAFLGMSLFFVLSGFVLAITYHASFAGRNFLTSSRVFFNHRIARIAPLYLFVMFVFLAVTPWSFLFDHKILPYYLTVTQSWFYVLIDNGYLLMHFYPHSWSISTEVFFYVIFPLVITFLGMFKRSRALLAFVFVLYCLLVLGLWGLFKRTDPATSHTFLYWLTYFSPYGRLFEFILGSSLGLVYIKGKITKSYGPTITYGAVAALFIVLLGVIVTDRLSSSNLFLQYMKFGLLFAPFVGACVYAAAAYDTQVSRFLSSKALVWGGSVSYSIYLIHPLVISRFSNHVTNDLATAWLDITLRTIVMTVLVILFSLGTYTFIEVPARRWIRSMTR